MTWIRPEGYTSMTLSKSNKFQLTPPHCIMKWKAYQYDVKLKLGMPEYFATCEAASSSKPPGVIENVDNAKIKGYISRSSAVNKNVVNERVVNFDLKSNINTDPSDISDIEQTEKVASKSTGYMRIPLTQIEDTAKMVGKPSELAIRSGAFLTTECDKKELSTSELDL